MTLPALLTALVLTAQSYPASAHWQRIVYSGKGSFTDSPPPHALGYFTANPFLHDEGDDLCADCTPPGRLKSAATYSIRTVVSLVGTLHGYRILDVLYYVARRDSPANDEVKWKSILVQVAPDRYREIFFLSTFYVTVAISPSQIVQSGTEPVLATMDSDGGNGGGCWEGYWWFDSTGPHPLDFSPLAAAIAKRTPPNSRYNLSCSSLNLAASQVQTGVQKADANCHACDWIGQVTARFRLHGPLVTPVEITFDRTDP